MPNAHCAQSGFSQGESARQHFHCRESHIAAAAAAAAARPEERRRERQAGKQGKICFALLEPTLLRERRSCYLATFPPLSSLLAGCHLFLRLLSRTFPHIPFILSLPISPVHFSSLLTQSVYAESGTFCDDQRKVLQCSSKGCGFASRTQAPRPKLNMSCQCHFLSATFDQLSSSL